MVEQLSHGAILLLVAAGLALIGHWGVAHSDALVPDHLPGPDREKRAATLRRGAIACYLAAGVLGCAAALAVL